MKTLHIKTRRNNESVNIGVANTFITESGRYIVPEGVSSITVWCWGAGGNGSGGSMNRTDYKGGGGGAFAMKTFSVTPGTIFNYTVAKSSDPVSKITGLSQPTIFKTGELVAASGQSASAQLFHNVIMGYIAGNGGDARNSIGTITFNGGTANDGNGGGAAGTTGAGNQNTGGSLYGGNGGLKPATFGQGQDGQLYGGGGSGGTRIATEPSVVGGKGATGAIYITES